MAVKQKILIVDDDNNIAELISLYLTKECYDTKIVNDGQSATAGVMPIRGLYPVELPSISGVDVWVLRNRNL